MTTTSRPGAYYYYGMHAGADEIRTFTLYSSYDRASKTGTVVDLTGATFKAEGKDSDGVTVFEVTPTFVTDGSDGKVTMTIPNATTTTKKGESGEWALRITWADTTITFPIWGRFAISDTVLVD